LLSLYVHENLKLKQKNKLGLKSFQKKEKNLKDLKIKKNLKHLIVKIINVIKLLLFLKYFYLNLKYKDK